jgi:glutamate/tyrosine decarboxylase-like PLP-dependent enzyme
MSRAGDDSSGSRRDLSFLHPYFLGPGAENEQMLEELVTEFLRDHAFWRRNFHPEDGFRIDAGARNRPDFLAVQARTRQELYRLSAQLKRAVPFFHPRYVGHMSADLLLPGLVAKLVTTLYNPNNVAEEAAPVTLEMELEVGEDLARMFGYSVDEEAEPCAWGHLTGGGTVANYEALWNFRSLKFYGIALQEGARTVRFDAGAVGPLAKPLSEYSRWELLNLTIDQTVALRREIATAIREREDRRALHDLAAAVREERIEYLGTAGFFLKHSDLKPPTVLVPVSAHYSWEKGMKVLGFGKSNLTPVAVDERMRMDPSDLRTRLEECFEARIPVMAVVGVLGSTEFGTVDPIHEIVGLREEFRQRKRDFGIHVDAAWGGYLASVFRAPDGSLIPREELAADYRYFPSPALYDAFGALPETDSITVDPHKLGYVPYAAGAFVARNREVVDFITQEAAYVFDLGDEEEELPRREKLLNLGQYILEGSKPGAAAAAVHVTHRVLPPDSEGFGRLLGETVRATEYFWDTAREARERLAPRVRMCVPFEPDSNLICIAMNPGDNRDAARMNRFSRAVFSRMKVDADQPLQLKTFIGSYTSLTKGNLPGGQADRILSELDLDPTTFVSFPEDPAREADHLYILRHTLMNPWLMDGPDRSTYVDLYWAYLESLVQEVCDSPEEWR